MYDTFNVLTVKKLQDIADQEIRARFRVSETGLNHSSTYRLFQGGFCCTSLCVNSFICGAVVVPFKNI